MGSQLIRATVLVGGHPFDRPSLARLLESMRGVVCTMLEWPDAEVIFHTHGLDNTDVLVLYDMPGVGLQRGADGATIMSAFAPPPNVQHGWDRLLQVGVPVVAIHHALAGWPMWEQYAEILGGRFHYQGAVLRGRQWPDSGYRLDVSQTLSVLDPSHPVCSNLPNTFELTDETYLCPVFTEDVAALIGTDAPRTAEAHSSAAAALRGDRGADSLFSHPQGSHLVAWTHRVVNSTVTYVQPGDGDRAFSNSWYRQLLHNAILHAASSR